MDYLILILECTDEYGFTQAVEDKFLNPFEALSVPLHFVREGDSL